jgi:hypothetical protein
LSWPQVGEFNLANGGQHWLSAQVVKPPATASNCDHQLKQQLLPNFYPSRVEMPSLIGSSSVYSVE